MYGTWVTRVEVKRLQWRYFRKVIYVEDPSETEHLFLGRTVNKRETGVFSNNEVFSIFSDTTSLQSETISLSEGDSDRHHVYINIHTPIPKLPKEKIKWVLDCLSVLNVN